MTLNEYFIEEYFMLALQSAYVTRLLYLDCQALNDSVNECNWLTRFKFPCLSFGDLEQIFGLKFQNKLFS